MLFFNCVANIFGSKSDIYKNSYHYLNGQMKIYLKLTSLEYALFSDFYEFHRKYWREYIKKQQHLLMRAYIDSQNIYDISPRDKNDIKTKFNINMDEIVAMLALSEQMKNIVPQYRKCLSK